MEQIIGKKSRIQEQIEEVNKAQDTFDEKEDLLDLHHLFLLAVDQHAHKDHLLADETDETWILAGSPIWNEGSDFAEWLQAVRYKNENQVIPQAIEKRKNYSADNPSPLQMQLMDLRSDMSFGDSAEMEKLDKVWYDFVEWHGRKENEAIDKYLKGQITLNEADIIRYELDVEIGKDILAELDRLERVMHHKQRVSNQNQNNLVNGKASKI